MPALAELQSAPDVAYGPLIRVRHTGLWRYRFAAALVVCLTYASGQTTTLSLQEREALEAHIRGFSRDNNQREMLIRKWFSDAGCGSANLSEQSVRRNLPSNVICVLPGETARIIVVGAHTDHVFSGDGVVDNWTGSALLPALLSNLNTKLPHHTIIFVGFSAEEKGLVGSRYYVNHLNGDQRNRIDAMVNFDSLGLGPTEVWASHADTVLVDALAFVAAKSEDHIPAVDPPSGASADSDSFAAYHIPSITLHSVTQKTWPILHSPQDTLAAIKMSDYYDSYKIIVAYLSYLDGALKPPQ